MNTTAASIEEPSARFRGQALNRMYRIWLFRKFVPVLIAEVILFSALLYTLGRTVFIQRVIENGLNILFLSPSGIVSFIVSAFGNASTATKALTLGIAVLIALLIRHLTQGILRFILVRQRYFGKAGS